LLLPAALLCGLGVSSAAEGDIRDLIANAVTAATLQGIPVVSSAGNVLTGLAGQLSGAVIGNSDITSWKILPATIPAVIAVGGVTSGPPYLNTDFHGLEVDIWAPRNDTSPAAAYISGLISLSQAINPDLHPDTTTDLPLTLPGRIRDLLVDTAYTSSDLSAMCARHGA
jgi:hypothetical protein